MSLIIKIDSHPIKTVRISTINSVYEIFARVDSFYCKKGYLHNFYIKDNNKYIFFDKKKIHNHTVGGHYHSEKYKAITFKKNSIEIKNSYFKIRSFPFYLSEFFNLDK